VEIFSGVHAESISGKVHLISSAEGIKTNTKEKMGKKILRIKPFLI